MSAIIDLAQIKGLNTFITGIHEVAVCHVFLEFLGINSYRDITDLPGKSSNFPEKYFFVKLLTEFGPSDDV